MQKISNNLLKVGLNQIKQRNLQFNNKLFYQFGASKKIIPSNQDQQIVDFQQNSNIDFEDPQIQQLLDSIEKGDKKVLNKILKGLEQAENYQKMIESKNLDFSPKVLTETEVYRIIKSVVDMPEDIFIQQIQSQDQDAHLQAVEYFQKVIKKRINFIPNDQAVNIIKNLFKHNQEEYHPIWKVLKNEFQRRLHTMSIKDISNLVYFYSYANKHSAEFFRDIENELIDREFEYVPIDCIQKLLKGFSYCNLGSAQLYNKISKTIKLAQHEIDPLKLGEYAYMFSKSSENMKAGFGIYHVAEEKITNSLHKYNFKQLTKISKFFMAQGIGSSDFLCKVEEQIYKKYPSQIEPSQLLKLCKSMSKYYFLYKDRAIQYKLEADCIKYLEHMSAHQISEVVWSFARGKSGSYVLYDLLEENIVQKLSLFTIRNLAFIYYNLCISGRGSPEFYKVIESEILSRDLNNFSSHYIVKIINGINIRNAFDSDLFAPILRKIESMDTESLKYTEIIKFLYMLVQAPPYYIEENFIKEEEFKQGGNLLYKKYDELFSKFIPILQQTLPVQKIDEICQIYVSYGQSNSGNQEFINEVLQQIDSPFDVPKTIFAPFLFTLCTQLEIQRAQQYIPIIQDLRTYGNIKFFFSHNDYIKLIYSCGIITQISSQDEQELYLKGNKSVNEFDISFWESCLNSLMEINPNTLKFHTVQIYIQTLMLVLIQLRQSAKYQQNQMQEFYILMENAFKKVNQLTPGYKQEIVQRDISSLTSIDIKHDIFTHMNNRIEKFFNDKNVKYQLIQNFVDELMNTVDIALFINQTEEQQMNDKLVQGLQKIAVLVINEQHFKLKDNSSQENILLHIQSKFSLMQDLLNWNLIIIDEQQWLQMGEKQKQQFFYDQIQLEDQSQEPQQEILQENVEKSDRKQKKTKKFSDKLDGLKQQK